MFRSVRVAALTVTSVAAIAGATLPATAAAYGPGVFSFVSVNDATCKYQWFIPHYTQPSIAFLKTNPAAGQPAAVRVDATFTPIGSSTVLATATLTTQGTQQNVNLGRFGGWNADVRVTFADGSAKINSTSFSAHGNPPCSF